MVENDHTGVSVILLLYLVFWVDALPLNLYEHTHLGERMAVQNYCTFIWIDNLLLMLQHLKLLKVTSSCLHLQTNKALCVHKLCKNPQRKRGHEATHTRDSFFVISSLPPVIGVLSACGTYSFHPCACVCTYLFALLLGSHLLKGGLKLPDKVVFSIRVPVPDCALEQTQERRKHRYTLSFSESTAATLSPNRTHTHTRSMQGNAMLND